jgi:hypothetical protein
MLAIATSLRSGCSAEMQFNSPYCWQSPQHHSAQGMPNNTTHRNNQQTGLREAKPGLRRGRPMGRSSKDTMESPYSARLPSSLSWRQNREDTSSSGNGRWAAPVFYAITSQSDSDCSLFPLRIATRPPNVWARCREHLQTNSTAAKLRLQGCHAL